VYRLGITSASYSYASAIGIFLSVISFVFIVAANQLARKTGQTSLW